jgi:methyl-accepting chemotaxis protein
MIKLENYSLKKRMQIVALLGVVFMFSLCGLYWLLDNSTTDPDQHLTIAAIFTFIASVVLYFLATYIGDFGAKRANTLVSAIQNIKQGDLTQSGDCW